MILAACAIVLLIKCFKEEARFRITNPQALQLQLGNDYASVTSARLIEYTDGSADLVTESPRQGIRTLGGEIDMLGVKQEFRYPLRFDFVTKVGRVRFVQAVAGPEIQVVTD